MASSKESIRISLHGKMSIPRSKKKTTTYKTISSLTRFSFLLSITPLQTLLVFSKTLGHTLSMDEQNKLR